MELEAGEILSTMSEMMERLNAAAATLERAAASMEERSAAAGELSRMVATVEQSEATARECELERRLAAAEQRIAELSAQETKSAATSAAGNAAGRKTLPAATVQLLAKQGIGQLEGLEPEALNAALTGLSLEQRIAVKAQLLRAGAIA